MGARLSDVRPEILLVGGLAAGAVTGYVAAVAVLERKYRASLEQQIIEVKGQYKRVIPQKPSLDEVLDTHKETVEAVEAVAKIVKAAPPVPYTDPEKAREYHKVLTDNEYVPDETVIQNIFDGEPEQAAAEGVVDETGPYIVGDADFMNNEMGFEEVALSWYEMDEILAKSDDSIETDIDGTVGMANLMVFKQTEGDNPTIYVRNNRLQTLFEVECQRGSFASIVMGYTGSDDEDEMPRPRRRRDGRDDG